MAGIHTHCTVPGHGRLDLCLFTPHCVRVSLRRVPVVLCAHRVCTCASVCLCIGMLIPRIPRVQNNQIAKMSAEEEEMFVVTIYGQRCNHRTDMPDSM